jgi:hypothetical protein
MILGVEHVSALAGCVSFFRDHYSRVVDPDEREDALEVLRDAEDAIELLALAGDEAEEERWTLADVDAEIPL